MTSRINKALALVASKIGDQATGEIVVVGASLEAHIYLQAGRIAWAYSNQGRSIFLREIMEVSGVDEEVVRGVLHECRLHRKHVAETLLEWGLVQERDVRRALWNQIATTLERLVQLPEHDAIFLRRRQTPYDRRLTFSIDEFDQNQPPEPLSSDDITAWSERESLSPVEASCALWARVLRPGQRGEEASVLGEVVRLLDAHEVIECAHRDPVGWLLGLRRPEGYLLCGLRPDLPLTRARRELEAPAPEPVRIDLGSAVGVEVPRSLASVALLFRSHEVIAGVFLRSLGEWEQASRPGAGAWLADQIRQLDGLLQLPLASAIRHHLPPSLVPISPGVRLVLPGVHLLGAPVGEASLWLAICPSVREITGWGLLLNAIRLLREPG
jgi:hypothetical protein